MHMRGAFAVMTAMVRTVSVTACQKKKPPVARPVPPPPAADTTASNRPPAPPEPVRESAPIPPEPIASDTLTDIDTINKNSPFTPVFFQYDSAEIDGLGQQTLNQNAEVLKKNQTWVITIEGHADERGLQGIRTESRGERGWRVSDLRGTHTSEQLLTTMLDHPCRHFRYSVQPLHGARYREDDLA